MQLNLLASTERKTAAYYFERLRGIILFHLEAESMHVFSGEIEVDESYFGGKRKGNHMPYDPSTDSLLISSQNREDRSSTDLEPTSDETQQFLLRSTTV